MSATSKSSPKFWLVAIVTLTTAIALSERNAEAFGTVTTCAPGAIPFNFTPSNYTPDNTALPSVISGPTPFPIANNTY